MSKRTKYKLTNAAKKRSVLHIDGLASGIAAILSAYLLAIATKFVTISGASVYASYLAVFSVVLLVIYKFMAFYESEGRLKYKNALGLIFSLGFAGGLISYFFILGSIDKWLAAIAVSTFCLGLLPFIWSFKKET